MLLIGIRRIGLWVSKVTVALDQGMREESEVGVRQTGKTHFPSQASMSQLVARPVAQVSGCQHPTN